MDNRSSDVSPEAMQARIQQARREAENLKDRIRLKKEGLADTSRESSCRQVANCAFVRPDRRQRPIDRCIVLLT